MYRQIHNFLRDALLKSSCLLFVIYLLMVPGQLEYIQSDIIDPPNLELGFRTISIANMILLK